MKMMIDIYIYTYRYVSYTNIYTDFMYLSIHINMHIGRDHYCHKDMNINPSKIVSEDGDIYEDIYIYIYIYIYMCIYVGE
jgi:hypothetical protein